MNAPPAVVKETKPFFRTSEFYVGMAISAVDWIAHASASHQFPLKWAVGVQAALGIAYKLSRGIAKQGTPYTEG